jgi:hypothetical protein
MESGGFFCSSPYGMQRRRRNTEGFVQFAITRQQKNLEDYQRLFKTYRIIYRLILKNFLRASLEDP